MCINLASIGLTVGTLLRVHVKATAFSCCTKEAAAQATHNMQDVRPCRPGARDQHKPSFQAALAALEGAPKSDALSRFQASPSLVILAASCLDTHVSFVRGYGLPRLRFEFKQPLVKQTDDARIDQAQLNFGLNA